MIKFEWKVWLQIVSNLAILGGLLLVLIELQQTKAIARTQLSAERVSQRIDMHLALAGENPGPIMMKACLEPNNLTPQDKFVISQVFQARIEGAMSVWLGEEIGGFGASYLDNFRMTFDALFNYKYGKEYFQRAKPWLPADVVALGEEMISRNSPSDCAEGSAKPTGF